METPKQKTTRRGWTGAGAAVGLEKDLHAKYLARFLKSLPPSLAAHDTTRLTLAFFAISGLDILDRISLLSREEANHIIKWIYNLQVLPEDDDYSVCGFQGSTTLNVDLDESYKNFRCGHVTMTYTGLLCLLILDDDLSRVDRKKIVNGLGKLQREDGNFTATIVGTEADMRFLYCAACISYILDDWSGFDREKAVSYILDCVNYDCGIGQGPRLESHGGTTFCAIATLQLSGQLHRLPPERLRGLRRWLINRQVDGFQGRPNKPVDTCYSFWVGATLKMLDFLEYVDPERNRDYVLDTQDRVVGGFSKWPDTASDPLHTYLGLGGLSLIGECDLKEIHPSLNITMRTFEKLKRLHAKWNDAESDGS